MHDQSNAYQELIEENSFLKHRVKELEQAELDRKQMEAALKESEKRLTDIIDFLPDATFAIDLSGKIIAWNRAVEDMTGVKAEDMLGKGNYEYTIPFYGTRKPVLIDLVISNTDIDQKNYDFVKRQGNTFLAEAKLPVDVLPIVLWGKAAPLYDDHGNIIGAIESVRDITEIRKMQDELENNFRERTAELVRTNNALHESEERLKLCMEATNDGLWDWNLETDAAYFNPGYYHMLGYEVDDFPAEGKAWKELIHPDDIENALSIYTDCIEGRNEKYEVEYRMKTKNGEWLWILSRGKCVAWNEQGYARRMVGTHVDITERKEMEKALQEREEQYRNFFSTSRDCVFITSVDGHWIDLNDAAVQLFGYDSREELLKVRIMNLYANPDEREWHSQIISKYGYVQDMPLTLRKKDGTVIDTIRTSTVKKDCTGKVIGYQGTIRDVTEQKRTEKLLRSSEERFRSLVETTSDWIWETDAHGIYTYVSPRIKDILGYEPSKILGKTPVSLMPGAEAARVAKSVLQHFREKKPLTAFENVNLHKDGRIVILETNGVPILNENGQLIGYRGVHRDITDRKHAEEALHKSEAILRSVFKATPVGLCIMKDRIFQSVNKAFLENLGYSEFEIIGHTTRMLYENEREFKKVGQEFYTDLWELGLTCVQTKLRRNDGSLRDVTLTAVPLQTKEVISGMAVVTVVDITDRKRAEEELYESRKQLANIIEFLPDATLVIDKKGIVIAWNRAMEIMTGVKKEDMIGKGNYEYTLPFYGKRRPSLIDIALKPDRKTDRQYTALQRIGDVLFGEEFTTNLPSGNAHVSTTASVLRDEKGKIIAAIECIRDNTERKKLEDRLNRAEKMESLGLLAGGVAHDLNNALGVVVGYAEMLLDNIDESHPMKNGLLGIMNGGEKAAAIIQDLLTLARRGVASRRILNLNGLIFDFMKSPEWQKLLSYHPSVQVKTNLDMDLLNISASSVHLEKTLMNLVSNACEAMMKSGCVTIKTTNQYLDRPIHGYDNVREGDYVVLSVSDTGEGIPESDMKHIFEPFYTKKIMGRSGTGLGLAVVWGTVKDHQGYINLESEEGNGTIFTLYFPVAREEITAKPHSIPINKYMGKEETILVVDDVKEQRDLAAAMLDKLNYKVASVASGEDAIEYLKDHRVDLLVLDMIMEPGMDGLDTYRSVLKIHPKMKAIIVSGFSDSDRVHEAQSLGAGSYVKKPYIKEKLGLAVRNELDRNE